MFIIHFKSLLIFPQLLLLHMFLIIYVAIFSGTTSSKDKYPKVNFWEFLEQELYKVNATNSNQYQI